MWQFLKWGKGVVEGWDGVRERVIMVVLGTLIGGMVVAMYLPIFKMGQAVG